ncbi:phosphomevalonate kinase [Brachybacterium sp. NPDC056505]|uniref:phosphomevalonate kinase n=1 Tax=Brachybacterium sp. NPDC056505 TaxID=3345843 RepID=UPI00366DF1DB
MIETRAPGKLYIAGEYAVVEPGHPAILVAVDRYLTVRLTEAIGMGRVHSSRYGHGPVTWVRDADGDTIVVDHSPFDYVTAAITILERLRSERGLDPRYFDLHIDSELDDSSGRKFGLGSSAAVTVAVVDALDRFYGLGLTAMERFRLALLATIHVAPKASGGDLAASTFGGWIAYTAPDRARLLALSDALPVAEVLSAPEWDVCTVRPLPDLTALRLLVGWTGSPASTERLVDRVRMSEDDLDAHYARFLDDSRAAVEELVAAWDSDPGTMLEIIRRCRRLLQQLGRLRGTTIETDQLRTLCDLAEASGAAGKPSGAGGGDCGIMLLPGGVSDDAVLATWREHDILRLDLRPHLPQTADTAGAVR